MPGSYICVFHVTMSYSVQAVMPCLPTPKTAATSMASARRVLSTIRTSVWSCRYLNRRVFMGTHYGNAERNWKVGAGDRFPCGNGRGADTVAAGEKLKTTNIREHQEPRHSRQGPTRLRLALAMR
jgi:hypothetical protein